jgi:hypothetical protein
MRALSHNRISDDASDPIIEDDALVWSPADALAAELKIPDSTDDEFGALIWLVKMIRQSPAIGSK